MTTNPTGWASEFGQDYAVPTDVTEVHGLIDQSWHNDVSPSFSHPAAELGDDYDLRLWVEHPDPEMREVQGGGRYTVTEVAHRPECFADLVTDDLQEAVRVLATYAATIKAARAAATDDDDDDTPTPATDTPIPVTDTLLLRAKCPACEFDLNNLPDLVVMNKRGHTVGAIDDRLGYVTICDSCGDVFAVSRRAALNMVATIRQVLLGEVL